MSQRQLVWRALAETGVLDSPDPRVQEWLKVVRERSDLCWADFVEEFRTNFYDVYEKVVPVLGKTDDAYVRNMLIKHADTERPKERQLLKTLATTTDFERDVRAAQQLAEVDAKEVETVLKKRIPEGVEALVLKPGELEVAAIKAEGGGEAGAAGGGKEAGGKEVEATGGGGDAPASGGAAAEGISAGAGLARPSRKGRT